MQTSIFRLIALCVLLLLMIGTAVASLQGDVNQDGNVDLQDAISGLQTITGLPLAAFPIDADTDVDGDNKVGLAEVLYTLGLESRSNLALQHQVIISGPLSGAVVTAYRSDDMQAKVDGSKKANISSTNLEVGGTFELSLPGLDDDTWIVVTATQGEDIDANGDGNPDGVATVNQGTLHAIARASDWRTKT